MVTSICRQSIWPTISNFVSYYCLHFFFGLWCLVYLINWKMANPELQVFLARFSRIFSRQMTVRWRNVPEVPEPLVCNRVCNETTCVILPSNLPRNKYAHWRCKMPFRVEIDHKSCIQSMLNGIFCPWLYKPCHRQWLLCRKPHNHLQSKQQINHHIIAAEMPPLDFQIRVGKQKCGGQNLPPRLE